MWDHHTGWMWGTGGLSMGLGWILIVIVIAVVVWLFVRGPLAPGGGQSQRRSALDVLKERYARGEVGREEFEQKKRDLES
jgi:putative membrane protein